MMRLIRFRTKAVIIYFCCLSLLFLTVLYFSRGNTQPKNAGSVFDHMAVDRVVLANDQSQELLLPKVKPIFNPVHNFDRNRKDKNGNVIAMKKNKSKRTRSGKVKTHTLKMSPSERLLTVSPKKLSSLGHAELSYLYHNYVDSKQIECLDQQRFGKVTDGGWDVCADDKYIPKKPCLVYSFGIGEDFSFDDAISKKIGCEVHSFDPSMKKKDYRRASGVHFHRLGLANFNGTSQPDGWLMKTLAAIKQQLGHLKTKLDILKIDIEEWEWKVLPDLLWKHQLDDVRQFLIEIHTCETCSVYNPQLTDKEPSKQRYVLALRLLQDIYKAGFRIYHTHRNAACQYVSRFGLEERSACHELHFVNIR
ncbi:methyltransferase-like protein 24 [Gigantopelta aegis]|uniref:methyltransferase-like protein 24 n=1 Tax=Gigantopelta aegis TaxID=1735272 RepID=UPI001B88CC30|nr:methyltransferase-like protein 24 [Gigantopelta aegis]